MKNKKQPACIWVVTPKGYIHSRAFETVSIGLKYAFLNLGFDVPVISDPVDLKTPALVLGGHLLGGVRPASLPAGLIIYNLEQIEDSSPWITPGYINLLKRFPVWDYSLRNIEVLKGLGVEVRSLLKIGYERELTRIVPVVEDIDVLFYGSQNERREEALGTLRRKGLNVVSLFGVFGDRLDQYIARSKIVINIHFYEARVFEVVRVFYLLANRKFVISETGLDRAIEEEYKEGVVFSAFSKLAETCQQYICDDRLRESISLRGFELAKGKSQTGYLSETLNNYLKL